MKKASKVKKKSTPDSKYRPDIQSLIPKARLSSFGVAYSLAIVCSVSILALSLAAKYTSQGTATIEALKPFFLTKNTLQLLGIASNMAEAALHGLVFGLVFTWLYNKLA
ncbi:hypothetical protein A2642_05035 [Candidatus Nomurabacteria bacterium RIFCSPHIGHO2_01_FULL_39_10]|uniref:Uncharacterized protein n=1 Tax=Candidatus Nomurabacteria bacterium RIFCSPHIGHO2_01_FULL_39_10 TaxID=1801733 RepID=A0A1F6V8Y9_9BACT|nr:MAG: hypothetical protein A2642_05035 [Candidatus Nomurabacteria bacterium RIFCSPHIGHO2_01_FULL_39_10]